MGIRRQSSYLYFLAAYLSLSINNAFAQRIITDTIYYDQSWRICEEPIATYYFAALLAAGIYLIAGTFKD
jgi:hypothetical protein